MVIIKVIDSQTLDRYSNDYLSLLANVRIYPTHKKYSSALIFAG